MPTTRSEKPLRREGHPEGVDVPLIIWGRCRREGQRRASKCCEAARGERCLIGTAKEDNYKTLTASCMADGHALITESPLDINIAKQVTSWSLRWVFRWTAS